MTTTAPDFSTHGQQLLCASAYTASEQARLLGVGRQRLSDWRRGTSRPDSAGRQAIAKALGIPSTAWDAGPVRQPAQVPPPAQGGAGGPSVEAKAPGPPTATDAATAVVDMTDDELGELGAPGIAKVIARLRAMEGELPPRERVTAAVAEGRLHDRLVAIRARDASARRDYFDSAEFREDVALLAGAFRASGGELRTRLSRLGVDLPLPVGELEAVEVSPPETAADVEELLRELEAARDFVAAGEPHLAAAHLSGLALDVHADALAKILIDHADLASRVLGLLPEEGPDHLFIRGALERRVALRDVTRLPPDARRVVGALLALLGQVDAARELVEVGHG